MATSGYSGTPLAKKLGIKSGYEVLVFNTPTSYLNFFRDFPSDVMLIEDIHHDNLVDIVHFFASTKDELITFFLAAKKVLKKAGAIWVSWPKKTSKIPSSIDKFDVMQYGLDIGLVDVKVAAINDDWSGIKFMYRIKDR